MRLAACTVACTLLKTKESSFFCFTEKTKNDAALSEKIKIYYRPGTYLYFSRTTSQECTSTAKCNTSTCTGCRISLCAKNRLLQGTSTVYDVSINLFISIRTQRTNNLLDTFKKNLETANMCNTHQFC
jgi:hypothetical protein